MIVNLKIQFSISRVTSSVGFLTGLLLFIFSATTVNAEVLGTWSTTGSLNVARDNAIATLLQNGKVLVEGGDYHADDGNVITSAELYDPATTTWTTTGSLNQAHDNL